MTVGAEDAAKRMLAMPVRVAYPQKITGLIDDVENPAYATAIGLLYFGKNFSNRQAPGMMDGLLNFGSIGPLNQLTHRVKKLIKHFLP